MAADRLTRRLAAIVAADVVGYSRMMETDEAGTHARLKSLRYEVFEPITERYGGRIPYSLIVDDGVYHRHCVCLIAFDGSRLAVWKINDSRAKVTVMDDQALCRRQMLQDKVVNEGCGEAFRGDRGRAPIKDGKNTFL